MTNIQVSSPLLYNLKESTLNSQTISIYDVTDLLLTPRTGKTTTSALLRLSKEPFPAETGILKAYCKAYGQRDWLTKYLYRIIAKEGGGGGIRVYVWMVTLKI